MYDLIVIGAGPIGIATAREAANRDLKVALIDRGPLLGAMFQYPTHMKFFSSSDKISICNIPFPTLESRPTRFEALEYYRLVATHPKIDWHLYQKVKAISGEKGNFEVITDTQKLDSKFVVVATGFFNEPVMINIPGEFDKNVSHYFSEGHAYAGLKTVIVGAANSAVIAALECWRHGADVILVHRGDDFHKGVKYWLRPDIKNRIKEGSIKALWNSVVIKMDDKKILLQQQNEEKIIDCDKLLILTGYRADFFWLKSLGLELDSMNRPIISEETFESNSRPGLYCAGCVLCGNVTNELFIENGRFHAKAISENLVEVLKSE